MTFQTSVANPDSFGPAGTPFGSIVEPRNGHNSATEVAGVWSGDVTYSAGQTNTVEINGIVVTVAGATDSATTRTALVAALQAESFLDSIATFAAGASNTLTITEVTPGSVLAIAGSGSSGADVAITVTTASASNDDLDPGLFVLKNLTSGALQRPNAAVSSTLIAYGVVMARNEGIDYRLPAAQQHMYPAANGGCQVPVIHDGGVMVVTEETVTEGSSVFYRITASGSNTTLGAFRTDNDSGNAVQLTGARFLRGVNGAGRAPLALHLP